MNKVLSNVSEHYNGEIKVKFYPNSHRYQLEGRRDYLIGVTTATGMIDKSRPLMIWASRLAQDYLNKLLEAGEEITAERVAEAVKLYDAVRDEAATVGTLAHKWAHQYISGSNPNMPEDQRIIEAITAFLRWVNDFGVRFIESEKVVYSLKHEYVGTLDCVFTLAAENHEVKHLGDFKTSSGLYLPMALQASAYQEAMTEEYGTQFGSKWLLRFAKEDKFNKSGNLTQKAGDFEYKSFPTEDHDVHFRGFLACLEIKKQSKRWDKDYGFYS